MNEVNARCLRPSEWDIFIGKCNKNWIWSVQNEYDMDQILSRLDKSPGY
jgi:hypothetical protein